MDTKQRREMKKRWFERVHAHADAIFDAQLDLALGCYAEKETLEGVKRVYKRPPDAKSLHWIMEQAWKDLEEPKEADNALSELPLDAEGSRLLKQAIAYVIPKPAEHRQQNHIVG